MKFKKMLENKIKQEADKDNSCAHDSNKSENKR